MKRYVGDGRYERLSEVGRGATSIVYLARDLLFKEGDPKAYVVVKVYTKFASSAVLLSFFRRESVLHEKVTKLNCEYIAKWRASFIEDDEYFHVFEFIKGGSLADQLADLRKMKRLLPIRQVIRYGLQLGDTIKKAHDHDITNNDIKPSNMMITEDGQISVTDWGLAQLSKSSLILEPNTINGTLRNMSPEQFSTDDYLIKPVDIRAMGLVIYKTGTLHHPFQFESRVAIMSSIILNQPCEPLDMIKLRTDVPVKLSTLVWEMISADAGKRPHIAEVISRLEDIDDSLSLMTDETLIMPLREFYAISQMQSNECSSE
jgi:eukaryotic-like serine/threonine-protein kinase